MSSNDTSNGAATATATPNSTANESTAKATNTTTTTTGTTEEARTGNCQLCSLTGCILYTVNTGTWEGFLRSNRNLKSLRQTKKLCGFCLKGRSIPVLSRVQKKWLIGQVEAFDWQTRAHRVKFDEDAESETVTITSSPFSDYVQSFKMAKEKEEADAADLEERDCDAINLLCSPIRHKFKVGNHVRYENQQFGYFDGTNDSISTDEISDHFSCYDPPIHFADENGSSLNLLDEDDGYLSDYASAFDNEPMLEMLEKEKPSIWRVRKSAEDSAERSSNPKKRANSNDAQQGPNKAARHRYAKKVPWSPVEDAKIFELFDRLGSKWTSIAKLLPGRNASSAKNRYHSLRRKMDDLLSLNPTSAGATTERSYQESAAAAVDCILALHKEPSLNAKWKFKYDYQFGPFYGAPVEGAFCGRCLLLVPSDQTGREICSKTNWCRACTNAPPFFSGDLLRKMHKQQHDQVAATVVKTESA